MYRCRAPYVITGRFIKSKRIQKFFSTVLIVIRTTRALSAAAISRPLFVKPGKIIFAQPSFILSYASCLLRVIQ